MSISSDPRLEGGSFFRLRLGVLGIVVVSLFAVLLGRLWYLQVLAAPTYKVEAEGNRVRLVYEEPTRGRLLDRKGQVLVTNRVVDVVTMARSRTAPKRAVLDRLAVVLQTSPDVLRRRLADRRYSPYKPVPLADAVPKTALVYIKEHRQEFPGVDVERRAQRTYPNGTLAAHLLGYVGEINDRELAVRKKLGYRLGDDVGKAGAEQVYEDALRGRNGVQKLEVDSKGKVLRALGYRPPVQGNDVWLTIDLNVQRLAEASLAEGLTAARRTLDKATKKNFVAPAGSMVVLDPRDGSVVALASNPTYDPAQFLNGIKPSVFKALQDPANKAPLTDRAIQGLYAPGSTFKLITATSALQAGLINGNWTVDDKGCLQIGNVKKCNAGKHAYGHVRLDQALTVSSDVFFYTLGQAFWNQRARYGQTAIQGVARAFGMGAKTGIPLPGESVGRVPDPEGRKRLHARYPKAFPEDKWRTGDNVNLAIGQGELVVTPLQLANAYATFANGGTVFAPKIGFAVVGPDGKDLKGVPSPVVRKVPLPPQVRDPILAGLSGVTASDKGTAYPAFATFPQDRFPLWAKTGTAEVGTPEHPKQDTSVFVAVAPSPGPQYVVATVMEESGFGAQSAAPVTRHVLEGLAGVPLTPIVITEGTD